MRFSLFFLALLTPAVATAQSLEVLPAKAGVWVNARQLYNPTATIRIERDGAEAAVLRAPRTEAEFLASYRSAVDEAGQVLPLTPAQLSTLWQRFRAYYRLDSLGHHGANNLPLLSALGAAYFDRDAKPGSGSYTVSSSQARNNLTARVPALPRAESIGRLAPSLIQPTRDGVYLEFVVEEPGTMQTVRVSRSYYLRSGYEPIAPTVLFNTGRDGKTRAIFTDYTATPKVPYTYRVVPVDAAGNEGVPSREARLFNAPEHSVPPSVRHFSATSATVQRAVRLSWLPPATPDAVSVDIFKSPTYNGGYVRIASLAPTDTAFLDYNVEPVTTYWYTAVINGALERSVQSPRVSGTLRATDKSRVAPRAVSATPSSDGKTVTISWERAEVDSRGYYIYRADGYTGTLVKLRDLLPNASPRGEYRDTLPTTARGPQVYTYAVTSENTSYSESPHSERAAVQIIPTGEAVLPIVSGVAVSPAEDGSLRVIWRGAGEGEAPVSGYNIYRTATDATGKAGLPKKLNAAPVRASVNFFGDADVQDGWSYSYAVHAVGADGAEGGPSLPAGYTIPTAVPLPVSGVQAFSTADRVRLAWTTPQGEAVSKVRILRAPTGKEPKEIAALDSSADSYEDTGVKKGEVYHYFFVTENGTGRRSEPTVPVSVAID